jgi:hypothetical protein
VFVKFCDQHCKWTRKYDRAVIQASKINAFRAGLQLDLAENWTGASSTTVDVTSTEEENVDSETASSAIDFNIRPVADGLNDSWFKANVYGYKDTLINVPMELL